MERFLFHFRVTNSKLKNKNLHFELLTRWLNFYFFRFRVTNSREKKSLRVTNLMGALLFFHFQVTNVKLINEEISLIIAV